MSVQRLALAPGFSFRALLDRGMLRSSAVVFFGIGTARLLAFLFYVAAARLLAPDAYGRLAYALAVVTVAAMFVTNAPNGMARYLARQDQDPARRDAAFTNWLAVVALTLAVSVLLVLAAAPLTGLSGVMVAGVVLNVANMAVFEAYQQAQRGLGRFRAMAAFYILANLLQLVVALGCGAAGWRSPALFLTIYGLSAFASVVLMQLVAPTPLRLDLGSVVWRRLGQILRYIRPLLIQGLFYAAWWSADLILVQRLLQPTAAGNYAVAKTLVQVLILAPMAIGVTATRRVAQLDDSELRRYVPRLLAMASMVIIPLGTLVVLLREPLILAIYGSKYPHAQDALPALVVGVSLHGLYLVTSSFWGAVGRPTVGPVATSVGTVVTVAVALLAIPSLGLVGGALGFAAGAAAQVAVMATFTAWGLYTSASARIGHLPDEAILSL